MVVPTPHRAIHSAPRSHVCGRRATSVRRPERSFDLHPDGERVAVAPELGSFDRPQDRLIFVSNFFDELRRMATPTAKR